MRKSIVSLACLLAAAFTLQAQNTQEAAAAAAAALSAADDVPEKVEKPTYWTQIVETNVNFGQTYLSQWAAGGYNNVTLAANIDAQANYARDKMKATNHLQLDYGFLWSADKPILQTNKDRIYFDAKWGYESFIKNLSYSGSFDFKTQFGRNYNYKTPPSDGETEPSVQDWLDARQLKSGFFAPAYVNIGVGALWTPFSWFSLNLAPLSGGGVFVSIPSLRYTYGMELGKDSQYSTQKEAYEAGAYDDFRAVRFELGAQMKLDMAWVINDVFSYTTQFTAFYNYLKPKVEPRLTWDNKIHWKLRKYFALTFSTNLIYDPMVIVRDSNNDGVADSKGVQFKEYLEFGFTYSITRKR